MTKPPAQLDAEIAATLAKPKRQRESYAGANAANRAARAAHREISAVLDPFTKLDKRERLALRQALESATAAAPPAIVRKLAKLDLVAPTGHMYEPQEWGKVVKRWPTFSLTPAGKRCAQAIVALLTRGEAG